MPSGKSAIDELGSRNHTVPVNPPMQHIQKALNDEASETAGKIMEVLWRPGRRAAAEGLDTIRQYAVDLRDDADKVKAAEGILEDIEKTWPEAKEVDRLADELETARAKLKQRRESNTEYLAQTEKVAGIKRQKKEHQQILSDYLVAHFKLTGERQVLMNDETGDAREVNITAKLGRETKYQTSLDLAPGQS